MLRPMLSLRLMAALSFAITPKSAIRIDEDESVRPSSGWSGPFVRQIDPRATHCLQASLSMRTGSKSRRPHQF